MSHTVQRYHDISCGHRVVGHENKCRYLHGHNYRIHFTCQAEPLADALDHIGRVIDFGQIKERLCMWVENNWDHRFIAWEQDPLIKRMGREISAGWSNGGTVTEHAQNALLFETSVVYVPFNPTAENMAEYLVNVIGPQQLKNTGIVLTSVTIEETAKCSATYTLIHTM